MVNRIGELLPKQAEKFDSKSTLLGKDVKFHKDSIAVWIRSPKVWTNDSGTVVEVW